MGKGLRYCFECSEFPCGKLQPVADGAAMFPHNIKVYNLCRMQRVGVETLAQEESAQIRKRFFQGKFKVGIGPANFYQKISGGLREFIKNFLYLLPRHLHTEVKKCRTTLLSPTTS